MSDEVKLEEQKSVPEQIVQKVEQPSAEQPVAQPEQPSTPEVAPQEEKKEVPATTTEIPPAETPAPKEELSKEIKAEQKEALTTEIKKTEEELSVIKEVREELVVLYAKNKEAEAQKESLSKQLEETKQQLTAATERLAAYDKAEAELKEQKRQEKLSTLSAKFKELGQEKSVEQLSKLDDVMVVEFESIVDAAIAKSKQTEQLKSVTAPSQGIEKLSTEQAKPAVKPAVKAKETNADFFARMCGKMTAAQLDSNKTIRL